MKSEKSWLVTSGPIVGDGSAVDRIDRGVGGIDVGEDIGSAGVGAACDQSQVVSSPPINIRHITLDRNCFCLTIHLLRCISCSAKAKARQS